VLDFLKRLINDKGSRRQITGTPALFVKYACIALILWEIYAVIILHPFDILYLPIHLFSILSLVFLLYSPPNSQYEPTIIPWYDFCLFVCAILVGIYFYTNTTRLVYRHAFFDPVLTGDLIAGTLLILLLAEATRRVVGNVLVILGAICFLYPFLGMYIPGLFRHRGFAFSRVIEMLTMTTSGIFGTPVNVAATYALMFVLFGAILDKSGTGEYFFDLAQAVAGGSRGGLAKTSIVASALFGSISGSPISNVVTTGSFTIPSMKKNGYQPHFAAAVETAASCGGTITPPVMGSVAFVMAEIIGYSYGQVLIAAIFPALLYYIAVFIGTDSQAIWRNLRGLDPEEVSKFRRSIRSWNAAISFILPMVWLVYRVIKGFTAPRAAFEATILVLVLNLLFGGRKGRMSFGDILDALEKTVKDVILVSVACGASGIIIGIIILTGIGPS
jgi:TRAP transporter 4TM/12TM fusion protein